jgi:hypothetical protein
VDHLRKGLPVCFPSSCVDALGSLLLRMEDVQDGQLLAFAFAVVPSNLALLGLRMRDAGAEGKTRDGLLVLRVFLMDGVQDRCGMQGTVLLS